MGCILTLKVCHVRGHGIMKRLILLPFVQRHLKLGDAEKHWTYYIATFSSICYQHYILGFG